MEVISSIQVHCLSKLKHSSVPEFYKYFHDELFHYIVYEYVPKGELLDLITNFGLPSLDYAHYFAYKIL